MNKKVAFYTLGCKLNFSETTTISEQFLKRGFDIVDYNDSADVYVVNTCSVTENAERECRQIVRRALRNNPDAYIIVTGCYAQLRPEEIAKIEGVSAILGSNEKFNLFNYINDFEISNKVGTTDREEKKNLSCIYVTPTEELNSFYSSFSAEANDRTRAFFKVQDGCDYKCSFCTIPLARGKSRSAKPDEIINEFKQLLNSNYKEIILTGVNVGDYGKSFGYNLYSLLNDLLKIDGEYRIRISSIEPNLLNDDLIDLIASTNKICNHLHIPLQSGSNKILRLMQRRYKAEDYHNLILKAVTKIKELAIGVDVIVGFPGETYDDFLETYNFLKDLPIAYLHVFTYSERPNTKAINLPGKVDTAERKKRNNMLRILSDKKRNEFYRSMIGREQTVLFESENHNGFMRGFSSNYIRIKVPYDKNLINQFITVKITGVDENIATAELSLKQVEL
ncbi:MAG: tRNA (N(6)-L-threonylcarbamoyladenosine(37)-C(2))-methylthiotransferase MtaB [Melioribacter sp.]|uniref:tRNA (N(6)-L-threonylcarbamoyladenosine(37)-C(2))- methylthiotransferase MtaB n=1 Tax=Rosettibacter primus TaxID=3111523 RepID=UPI00247EC151|nr:tRNA (N(6)-L-threonylcarbamoyladenosine(37)-C(2))-methylthiotransferase MtaB [Melioribacter sp.]